MRTTATWLIATLLCCGVAWAAGPVLVKSAGGSGESSRGVGLLIPSTDNTENSMPSNGWGNKHENNATGYQANERGNAVGAITHSPLANRRTTPMFVKPTQRASAANDDEAVWLSMPQPWTIVLIVLGWLAVAIVPALRAARWIRAHRAHGPRSRTAAPSMLTASLIQTQLRNQESMRKPECEEPKKSRRAA